MDIVKIDDYLHLIFPYRKKRSNPYMGDEGTGSHQTFIGIVEENRWGFAYVIDMEYKGKDDQWTDIMFDLSGEMDVKEFKKVCKEEGIDVIE